MLIKIILFTLHYLFGIILTIFIGGIMKIKTEISKEIIAKLEDHAKKSGNYRLHFTEEAWIEPHSLKWGEEKYSIQGHVEAEYDVPADYYIDPSNEAVSDYYHLVYSDRMSGKEKAAVAHLPEGYNYERLSGRELLELGRILSGRDDITGVRVVRETKVSSGHAVWYIEMIAKNPLAPKSLLTWGEIQNPYPRSYEIYDHNGMPCGYIVENKPSL